jgi:3'-phosphoadenosine 5'-phosphosulfate sulfotransferase (PAPS reductase)/FAD synthetase
MSDKSNLERDALDILDAAITKYDPRYVVGLFSGGHDSLTATHIASQHPRFSFAAHMNTGIGIEQTRQFVRDTCVEWGIELKEYKAAEYVRGDGTAAPQLYADLVKEWGFPGPPMHNKMFCRLKERPLRHMIRQLNRTRKEKVMLVTGIRAQESQRRLATVTQPEQIWEGTKVWVAPLWQFDKMDVTNYVARHGLKRNPVSDNLHMSGECLCGAFAKPGELDNIAFWYPEVAAEIRALEVEVREHGHTHGWEGRIKPGGRATRSDKFMPMCTSCTLNHLNDQGEMDAEIDV